MSLRRFLSHSALAILVAAAAVSAQGPGGQQSIAPNDPAADLARSAQQQVRQGQLDAALATYRDALQKFPDSFLASNGTGVLLDLQGRYADARKQFGRAIEVAPTPQAKAQAERGMAMSYAFESDCAGATKFETPLYDQYLAAKDFFNAGEIANELARICLESGRIGDAAKWYQVGHEAGLQEPNISAARKDLWEFRWEHALARIAARRGDKAEAEKHVRAAKTILDRGTNPDQAPFYPYLTGYVAFYTGDEKTALAELQKGNQNDPFILSLIAQTYEKLGDQAQAMEYYRKVLAIPIHNPTGAFARPLAQKKVGRSG